MTNLTFALPSKGRLKDNAAEWLKRCGFKLTQAGGERSYRASLKGLPDVDVHLLSAREIAEGLLSGRLHFGVTGEDLLHDLSTDLDAQVHVTRRLGFGGATLVVAVPEAWLDVETMADLEAAGAQFRASRGHRMRVATKYLNATRRFFSARSVGEYRLVYSAGATEAAPASGTAELIVDITTSGATLTANRLKILKDGRMLDSEAALTASLSADWSVSARTAASVFLASVDAEAAASESRQLITAKVIPEALATQLGLRDVTGNTAICDSGSVAHSSQKLCENGLGPVSVARIHYIFSEKRQSFDDLMKKI
ncbi:MAG: ATP phosphoribosyltransferase [Pseudomonadota bacterium]